MKYDPEKHRRRSIRLKEYDYSQAGAYFVTICTHRKECIFGEISNNQMILNEYGEVVLNRWKWLEKQYTYVKMDAMAVMPNHLHGILIITNNNDTRRGGSRRPKR